MIKTSPQAIERQEKAFERDGTTIRPLPETVIVKARLKHADEERMVSGKREIDASQAGRPPSPHRCLAASKMSF
ncbi:hypothetical protein ACK9YZ_29525 [Rhizobium sp. ZK1]|uniref:hypothetical protein n=1 Tax=Rhizobium sp. ZK1 TaxID=3389872 RepID=UPI0039F6CC9F